MDSSNDNDAVQSHGHFLYADYTPLEEDRNVIEILKAFVSLTSGLIRLHAGNKNLSSVLDDSDSLRNDIISAIKEIKTSTTSSIQNFRNRNSEVLASELHAGGTTLLGEAQTTLLKLLSDTETNFEERHQKYKENIVRKISENEDKAVALVHEWLSKDYMNLPRPALANLTRTVIASLDQGSLSEQYTIHRVTSTALSKVEDGKVRKEALRVSYKIKIVAKELEFWNHGRKVSELGIRGLMLPVGMKASISEKLRQTFKFGSKDSEMVREPDFEKVDDYYIIHAELQGQNTLSLQLAADADNPDTSLFKIAYSIDSLSEMDTHSGGSRTPPSVRRPRIDYRTMNNGQPIEITDLLQIGDIERMSELPKIRLLGTAILSKMGILTDPDIVTSRGRFDSLKIDESQIIKTDEAQKVDFVPLFEFLGLIASSLRFTLEKLKEKTPMKDELILRQEMPGGRRKEFTIRLDDLRSQLTDEQYGRPILRALGI